MIIDVHTHIFTLRSVLTREAVEALTRRLRDRGLPTPVTRAVEGVLDSLLDRPDLLDEREILARILRELRRRAGFDRFVQERLSRLPFRVIIRGEGLENLSLEALRQALDQLTTAFGDAGDPRLRPFDVISALRLAMKGSATMVADEILGEMGPDDVLVAHMIDIRSPDPSQRESERDRRTFLRQLAESREAALQRPGRILPFFGVHPARPDHFELLEEGVGSGAFVGVKLYPSLGYRVDSPEMLRIFRFCLEADVPVLLHSSPGGFYRSRRTVEYGDPMHWDPILRGDLRNLRVCFAHFGGWETLGTPGGLEDGRWGATILQLMDRCPHVYADVSYHTDQMRRPGSEARYFETLHRLLGGEPAGGRILLGSDSWLLRLEMSGGVFRNWFRDRLSEEDFRSMSERAPRSFLGFGPEEGGRSTLRPNLRRHLEFLEAREGSLGADPARWVRRCSDRDFRVERAPPTWHRRHPPSRCVWAVFRRYLTGAQRNAGFLEGRRLRLDALRYYRPRDPGFERLVVPGLATDLVGCCEDSGWRLVPGWEVGSAIERIAGVLRRGERSLEDLSALLEVMFEPPEQG